MEIDFDRAVRTISLVILAIIYGVLSTATGWFPAPHLRLALRQANQLTSPPEGTAARVHKGQGVVTLRERAIQPGLTLISSAWPSNQGWEPEYRLIHADGRTVHRWPIPWEKIFPDTAGTGEYIGGRGLSGSVLLPNGDLIFNIFHEGTIRLDACGSVEWKRRLGSHHSLVEGNRGGYYVSASRRITETDSTTVIDRYPGTAPPYWLDVVLRLNSRGTPVDSLNVLSLLYQSNLIRHAFQGGNFDDPYPGGGIDDNVDLTHLNDAEPLPDSLADEYPLFQAGDLLLSLREPSLILVADPRDKEVKWNESDHFVHQHDPDWIGNGWIGVFDNRRDGTRRGSGLGGSRIIAVQPHTDSVKTLFQSGTDFYSAIMGRWQELQNGNLLITEGNAGRVLEVDSSGEVVWEWIAAPRGDTRVSRIDEATRYSLTPEDVAAWPCSSDSLLAKPKTN